MIIGNPQKEYEDISNNLRHYGNLQFTQLTVFVVINLAMINLMFGGTNTSHLPRIILEVMGLSLSTLFFVMNNRVTAHWSTYSKRAMELEKILGYRQYTNRPPSGKFSNRNAVSGVYMLLASLWILTIILNLNLESPDDISQEDLHHEIMELRTKENESWQEITKLKSTIKDADATIAKLQDENTKLHGEADKSTKSLQS